MLFFVRILVSFYPLFAAFLLPYFLPYHISFFSSLLLPLFPFLPYFSSTFLHSSLLTWMIKWNPKWRTFFSRPLTKHKSFANLKIKYIKYSPTNWTYYLREGGNVNCLRLHFLAIHLWKDLYSPHIVRKNHL